MYPNCRHFKYSNTRKLKIANGIIFDTEEHFLAKHPALYFVMAIATNSSSTSSSSSSSEYDSPNNALKRKPRASDSDSDAYSDDSSSESEPELKTKATKSRPKTVKEDDGDSVYDSDSSSDEEEVQVLSHKAQRRLKKKEKKLSKSAATDNADVSGPSNPIQTSPKKEKGKKEKTADKNSQPRRKNSVWVGNLSFKTTPDTLRTFFNGVGEITRINMPTKVGATKGANKG